MTRLPDEIDQLRSAAQRVVTHLLLLEPEFHRTGIVPAEVGCTFAELGYFGMRLPATYGGSELGMLATVVVVQELGRLPPQFWPFLRVALGPSTKALVRHGTEITAGAARFSVGRRGDLVVVGDFSSISGVPAP